MPADRHRRDCWPHNLGLAQRIHKTPVQKAVTSQSGV